MTKIAHISFGLALLTFKPDESSMDGAFWASSDTKQHFWPPHTRCRQQLPSKLWQPKNISCPPKTKLQAFVEHRTRKSSLSWQSYFTGSMAALVLRSDNRLGMGREGNRGKKWAVLGFFLWALCVFYMWGPLNGRAALSPCEKSHVYWVDGYREALKLFCWSHSAHSSI